MPEIDIEDVEAEIVEPLRPADARRAPPRRPDFQRLIREATAREAWRAERLSPE
ncbi:hypothetical protein [Poseidonocella sp. HB161398]|uniref:hypothetical protein n=1 Tax=Poseidonocella sp. HB161398 TaxID=2320855 RepID=UPI001485EDC0|nr:hypothetical protein [Poseidonocella sp. HB161398]